MFNWPRSYLDWTWHQFINVRWSLFNLLLSYWCSIVLLGLYSSCIDSISEDSEIFLFISSSEYEYLHLWVVLHKITYGTYNGIEICICHMQCIHRCYKMYQVCTVVQYCFKGRSKRYRKWPFLGCWHWETPLPIYIKFGVGDYVGDATQYIKWHVNRFRGVTPRRGKMLMVCAFLICSLVQLETKPLNQFWRAIPQNACFCDSCIPLGLEQQHHNFRGQNPPKPPKIVLNRHFPAKMPKSYNGHICKTVIDLEGY